MGADGVLGNPKYVCELQPIDFAAFARACDATGFSVENPAQCSTELDQTFSPDRCSLKP